MRVAVRFEPLLRRPGAGVALEVAVGAAAGGDRRAFAAEAAAAKILAGRARLRLLLSPAQSPVATASSRTRLAVRLYRS